MLLNAIFKPGTRSLLPREIALARLIFGDYIPYHQVRIDETARIGCRHYNLAYVGFYCINTWGPLSDAHFIHEMVHIWQYHRHGSVYIPRALHAQRTPEGYHYGGAEAIRDAERDGKQLSDFNYEQQGEIVADYFCLLSGAHPRYCPNNPTLLPLYQNFVQKGLS